MTYGGAGQGYPQQPESQPYGQVPQQGQPQPQWQYPPQQPPQYQQPPQQYPPQYPQQQPYPPQYPPQYPAQYPAQQPHQQPVPGPRPEVPLTLPGWGAFPAALGLVLSLVGLFALKWVHDATFSDLNKALQQAATYNTHMSAKDHWIDVYFPQGAIIALFLGAVPALAWGLGPFRSAESIRKRGGLTRRSLSAGNTGPTRVMISVIAGLCLLYQAVTLYLMTDNGKHLDELGPGPWLLLAGAALTVIGAVIGPRVPGRGAYPR
jgi:hypothetical protein